MPFVSDRKERIIKRLFEASGGNIATLRRNVEAARERADLRRENDRTENRTEG